jgi:hypothetical protein
VGKTTTVSSLEGMLPEGSVVVAYDCFGAGEYLSPTETRHLADTALMEMINEISLRCGSALLLEPPRMPYLLWRRFGDVLGEAAKTVSALGGRFVLVIDAIDNAVVAGRERKQGTFVEDLVRLGLPAGVTVLLSCRTHRMADLPSEAGARRVELRGFDQSASSTNLRERFPEADEEVCRRFHERSGGNPRSQFYLLDAAGPDPVRSAAEAADRAHKTPEDYFDDLLEAAVGHGADPATASRLADLICLTRPVELATLAGVGGVDAASALGFCRALVPGVRLGEEDAVEFRDEDFEIFLRGKVSEAQARAANSRIADHYWARRGEDPAAADQVAQHLALAGRREELMSLALEEGQPDAIADPVARLQTYFRRLTLAMQVAEEKPHREDAFRLTLLAAQAARTDQAVATIVRSRPDLAMRYGDRHAIAEIYEAAYREPWRGPMHLRVAALDAGLGDREGAEEQLRLAGAWLRIWVSKEPAERHNWQISAEDAAAGAEAVYLLRGPRAGFAEVTRWRPLDFSIKIAEDLVLRVTRGRSGVRVCNQLGELGLPAVVEARLQASLFAHGHRVPAPHLHRVVAAILGDPPSDRRLREDWTIDFLELVAYADRPHLAALLELMGPSPPERIPFEESSPDGWGPSIRLHALRAAAAGVETNPEELMPVELRADHEEDPEDRRAGERREDRRRRLMKVVTAFLPVYHLRARGLTDRMSVAALGALAEPELGRYEKAAADRWHEGDHTYRRWAVIVTEALIRAPRGDAAPLLRRVADQAPVVTGFSGVAVWTAVAGTLLRKERYRDLAYQLLDRAAETTEASEEPASEKAETLLEISGLLESGEETLAADYYNRAVEAAEGLDEEGAGVLSVNARLADRARSAEPSENAAIAERLARSVERFRPFVGDPEALPWAATAGAAAALRPAAGLALASRWEEEDLLQLSSSMPTVLASCQEAAFLSPQECLALLGLAEERSYSATAAIGFLETLRTGGTSTVDHLQEALRALTDFVQRGLLSGSRLQVARELSAWIDRHELRSMPGAEELIALAELSESLPSGADPSTHPRPPGLTKDRREVARQVERGGDGRVDAIAEGLSDLAAAFARDQEIEDYLANLGAQMPPQDRVAALQAISEPDEDGHLWRFHGELLLRTIGRWISAWKRSGPVRAWARDSLPIILRDRFVALTRYEETAERAIEEILALPELADPAAVIIEALGPNLPKLGARQLHAIARGLVSTLTPGQALAALEWSLTGLEDGEPPGPPSLPADAPTALARLLRALFGNPDKRLRWRAAHVGRALSRITGEPLVSSLVELISAKEAGPFAGAREPFYWMSAQQWLLLLLARLADDFPAGLERHLGRLTDLALDESWPHASVRELARRAALRLDRSSHSLLPQKREELLLTNRPRSCRIERGHSTVDGHNAEYKSSFAFDSMDTLPYWFGRLARVFDIDPGRIAAKAGDWIVEKLQFPEPRVEQLAGRRDRRYEYDEVSNRQGSYPRVETLRLYLEYHSMLLTAGELVAEGQPILWEDYQDAEDPWESWLAQHLDASPDWWSSDLRSPVPLDPQSYGALGPLAGWRERSTDDFDRELGLTAGSIVVAASTEVSDRQAYGQVFVTSALVSPTAAGSLLRALQTCRDPMNFQLPEEDGVWASDSAIDQGDFKLWGWLVERRHHETGLEEHDPLRRIDLSFTGPGSRFVAARKLTADLDGRRLLDRDGVEVGRTASWSDRPLPRRGYNERADFSEGWRTSVGLDDLTAFLREENADLIVAIRLQRQFAEASGMDTEERYDRGQSRIYLLRADGRIEVVAGGAPVGRTDNRGAGS